MIKRMRISLFDMVMALSTAIDLISPALVNHHKRVAYIALCLAGEMGLPGKVQNDLLWAGLLHDCGALSLRERLDSLQFELDAPYRHAELGYLLLDTFGYFSAAAELVRFHHVKWDNGRGSEFRGHNVPVGSHILHLADRIDVLLTQYGNTLEKTGDIRRKIGERTGEIFKKDLTEAFFSLAEKEYFWLDAVNSPLSGILAGISHRVEIDLEQKELFELAALFGRVIDFRSSFTATHSSGVGAVGEELATLAGFSGRECKMMRVAGYLHDLGKLAIPKEVLEKPGKLTAKEYNAIKSHAFFTYRILENISALDVVNTWASFHHERLDGKGYPFHHQGEDLSLGSRIMAVADVFTAVTEDRPYRKGMSSGDSLQVLRRLVEDLALDANVVAMLESHWDEVHSARLSAQQKAAREYEEFGSGLQELS